jgi:hypothetical protein
MAFAYVTATGRGVRWLAVGLFAGLGVASKLTDLFLGLGVLLCLAVRRDLRGWLASVWTWAGAFVAAVVFMPVVVWNVDHGWVTFAKQFGRLPPGSFDPSKFPEFVATQFAVLNPLIAIFAGLAVVVWIRRKRDYPVDGIGLLMWTVLPLLAYMTFHSFHDRIQGQWLAPIFPALALVAAAAAEAAPAERWGGSRALAFPVGVVLSLIGLVLAANPRDVLPPWLDPGQANHGWSEVAAEADRLRRASGAEWIATTRYNVDAIVAYKLRGTGVPIVPVVERVRYAFAPPPDPGLLAKPALFLLGASNANGFPTCFATRERVGTIERRSGGKTVQTFGAYLATGAAPGIFTSGC